MQNIKDQDLLIAFGKHLRALRQKKGLTMQHLADLANIEYSQISRIEHGEINTTISTAYSLAKGLDIPLRDLFNLD